MSGSPGSLKSVLEEWLEQNFLTGYTSCIKINGRPILPPVMSEQRRIEMRRLRDMAIEVENNVARKKENNTHEDCAGGEAMYEGTVDELHFVNPLPTSVTGIVEGSVQYLSESGAENSKKASSLKTSCDMLKEFDPLAEDGRDNCASPSGRLLELNSIETAEKISQTTDNAVSKPSSADSSVALSYSTDLNNYMDITESSVDVSVPRSDIKSAAGTDVTTPSTIRPDSAESHPPAQWDGKKMYEDLNNYLDSLLNNSGDLNKNKSSKDSNQNVVNWQTLDNGSSAQDTQNMILSSGVTQVPRPSNSNPQPLTSPPGSLQSRIRTDNNRLTTPTKINPVNLDGSSNFLQDCALSPVVKNDLKNSYEQKVQLYLQNLVIDQAISTDLPEDGFLPKQPHKLEEDLKESCSKLEGLTSNNSINGTTSRMNSESTVNGYLEAPPRLVRSNSYTLESPSPMLLAHMEAELKKNVRNDISLKEQTQMSQNNGPTRRVWDVERAKNMPSWCNRQSNLPQNNPKFQSPKKVSKVSSPARSSERVEVLSDVSTKTLKGKVASKYSDNSKQSKSGKECQQEATHRMEGRSTIESGTVLTDSENSRDKVRALLLKVQLQHNQEMEELLNRQRQEKEAIRLALLKEQTDNVWKNPQEPVSRSVLSHTSANSHINTLSQSPPTKDKALLMERRNTSPSMYEKENTDELQSCLLQYNKSSSISLDDVSNSGGKAALINFECEEMTENIMNNQVYRYSSKGVINESKGGVFSAPAFSDTLSVHKSTSTSTSYDNINLPSDMISSFPPGDPPAISQLDSMTSSLPPEILSLQFSSTEFTFQNLNSVSCKTQPSLIPVNKALPVSACAASLTQNVLSSVYPSGVSGGSPHSKRRSWCSRQLFSDDFEWVTQSQEIQQHLAAARIQAGVRGYLTRRLLKTERVQNCITTIRDTIVCALQLQRDCAPHVEPSDLQLHGRLIQQLSAACEDLHNIFMGTPIGKRMAIIASDRERLRTRTPRSQSSTGSRPLSRATQIVLQRKMNQTDPSDSSSMHSRSSSANRSRRRSWATVESRVRQPSIPTANNCEVIAGCLSRSSVPSSHPLQRSASAGSSRKPWR